MANKALNLLGLMRRANAIQIGETNTGGTVKDGKAKLLLLAADASENARHRAEGFLRGHSTILVELPYTKEEISDSVGLPGCSMAAITDIGFAGALMKILSAEDAEKYGAAAEEIERRQLKAQRRKTEAQTKDRNKRIGKRRTNA